MVVHGAFSAEYAGSQGCYGNLLSQNPKIRLYNNLDNGEVRNKLPLLPIGKGLYGLKILACEMRRSVAFV